MFQLQKPIGSLSGWSASAFFWSFLKTYPKFEFYCNFSGKDQFLNIYLQGASVVVVVVVVEAVVVGHTKCVCIYIISIRPILTV